jgi:virulence-associated protein VapD
MFVIAFDLNVADVRKAYIKHPRGAYLEIERTVGRYGFNRIQDSVYAAETNDMANLFTAILALKSLNWFGPSVKNIRAFRMEQGSDFTAIVKG